MIDTASDRLPSVGDWRRRPEDCLRRLARALERREPEIEALVIEPDRLVRLRRELRQAPAGPLTGVPIGVKDIFHVSGLPTRAGCRLPAEAIQGPEAEAVTRLRGAGALVLGKTVTTEFAYFAPGPTRNPRALDHTPGGSSSGSAAAVAAGFCPLALGTQTIGSICRPASFCGIVGFKPTYDRISRAGVIPLSPSLDHVGLFASSIEDAEIGAAVLVEDWHPATASAHPRLAVPEGPYLDRASPAARSHFDRVCRLLASAGWEVVSVAAFDDLLEIERRNQRILAGEAARVHRPWFERFGDLYDARTRELIEEGLAVTEPALAEALRARSQLAETLQATMKEQKVDLWISPSATGPAPRGLESTGNPAMNLPWTHAWLPVVSLPAGSDEHGLPLGLQVTATSGADEQLLAWARELEPVVGSPS